MTLLDNAAKLDRLMRVQLYHSRAFAKFVQKLADTPDGDGSMLDHSLLVYGSNMSNSNAHDHFPLPMALVGGGCGKVKGGQHLRYPDRTPVSNLLLTVLLSAACRTAGATATPPSVPRTVTSTSRPRSRVRRYLASILAETGST